MVEYFNKKDELNALFGNGGAITSMYYTGAGFEIRYKSAAGIAYKAKIKATGEIIELVRIDESKLNVTEVWANYYELECKMIYKTSQDTTATNSWNITNPIYDYKDAPWYYNKEQSKFVDNDYANAKFNK